MSQQFDILIVEDKEIVIDAVKRILLPEGFSVDLASNGEAALIKVSRNQYKLIFSDLMLPQMSGIELIKKIRRTDTEIPIIIITGYATLEHAVQAFRVGAFDFIPKPFDIEELLGVVYRAMSHTKLKQKSARPENPVKSQSMSQSRDDGSEIYYMLGEHSWAKLDTDGVALFGVGMTFPERMGEIRKIEFPIINTDVWQGNLCIRIISRNNLINMVWAPLSGKIIRINRKIKENVDSINHGPRYSNWLVKVLPSNLENELQNLNLVRL